jgi:acyl dehydratase
MSLEPGDRIELEVTPDRYVTVRYAGASGDFNPIHIDEEFAKEVGLPGRILHGLWIMSQVARAHTEAAGGPEALKRLSVQFRGMGKIDETITITGAVSEVADGVAVVRSDAVQAGSRIIRNASASVEVAPDAAGATVAPAAAGATVEAGGATSVGSAVDGSAGGADAGPELPGAGDSDRESAGGDSG